MSSHITLILSNHAKVLLFCSSLIAALLSALWLSENIFFDTLLYQKSWLHGYQDTLVKINQLNSYPTTLKQFIHFVRNRDIYVLTSQIQNPTISQSCKNNWDEKNKRKITKKKPLTIVVIGDSNAYGMGIRDSQRYGRLLQKTLNKNIPTKVYILAESGNSIEEYLDLYIMAKDYLEPDLIIFGLLENDLLLNAGDRYPNSVYIRNYLSSLCGKQLNNELVNQNSNWDQMLDRYYLTHSPNFSNFCFAQAASKIFKQDQRILYFNMFNYQFDNYCKVTEYSTVCLHRFLVNTYVQLLTENRNVLLGFEPSLGIDGVSKLEQHPSAKQHQRISVLLAKKILGQLISDEEK